LPLILERVADSELATQVLLLIKALPAPKAIESERSRLRRSSQDCRVGFDIYRVSLAGRAFSPRPIPACQ
jgi:hypothetical protein